MFNPQLETFLHVADAGSFIKAAEESFITPTAVIKQSNSLEDQTSEPEVGLLPPLPPRRRPPR